MAIKRNITDVTALYRGDVSISKVYRGDVEIFSATAVDPDAQAFITAASITDITQQNAINQLVVDFKEESLWDKMDAIYPFVGGTEFSHKFNLKDPRDTNDAFRLEFRGNTNTYNADGVTWASGGYASTWCNPGNSIYDRSYGECVKAVQNDGWSGSYIGMCFGFKLSSTNITAVGLNNLAGAGNSITYPTLVVSSIISDSDSVLFANNTSVITISTPQNSPDGIVYLGAMNMASDGNGSPWHEWATRSTSFAFLGDGINITEYQTLNTIVSDFNTALGR